MGTKIKPPEKPIRLVFFDQLAEATPKPWVIKNVIARGETSSWIAPPGKGKSALLIDIATHLAAGRDWRGYRTKDRCGVVYFAIERADLVKRRLIAHRLRDRLPDLAIAVRGQVIDLMDQRCARSIVAAIHGAEQHFGCEVGLASLIPSRGIAAGGGDESHARDQNCAPKTRRSRSCPRCRRGGAERGSNARLADVDVSVQVSGDVTATVRRQTISRKAF